MDKNFAVGLAALVLAVCLLSGGCWQNPSQSVRDWRDLIRIPLEKSMTDSDSREKTPVQKTDAAVEQVEVRLYFEDPKGKKLVAEQRKIPKVEGIARTTLQELLKGPSRSGLVSAIPSGTRLLDINVTADGLCIVDLSHQATNLKTADQEKLMVDSLVNTLGQFSTVRQVSFMIDGQAVDRLAGFMHLDQPISPDYTD